MKKLLNNKLIKNYLIILIFTNLLEISFRLISQSKVFDVSLLRIFIGLNFVSLLISFILSWTNKKSIKIFNIIIAFIFSIYAFLQLGFNNFIGVYMSFNTTSQLGAVTDYVKEFLSSFLFRFYLIFIPFILLIIYYIFIDKFTELKLNKKFVLKSHIKYEPGIRIISSLIILFLLGFMYNETLTIPFMQNELQTVSNEDLFAYPSVPSLVINEFGVIGFGFLDVKSLYVEPTNNYVFNGEENNNISINTDRTFDDTLWNELISNESSNKLNNINNYLINNTISDYNDYTGLFEGKNLIVIMMESVNEIFINKDLYPNFYKLYSEGISFTNNYSPRNSCATGNNEFSAMTGIYSIQNNCTANVYRKNTYPYSIFNLFNNAGYKTMSMHDYTEAYYYRSIIHQNMGSGKYYGVQDLGIPYYNEYKNWASDEDFMKVAMDITLSDTNEPFMLWLTTVSSHQPYVQSSIEGDKYLSITEDTGYPMDLRRYMSKLKTLDNALGILLERLEESNELDDTVIALFGDHYPYGLKDSTINYVLDYDLDDYEREKTPFVIYNSEISPQSIDKYTSYINLTPTIANLFNLNYDPRLYMGYDVLSDDYWNVVTFADGSWKNNLVYYNAGTSNVKYYVEDGMSIDEIKNINQIITNKMQMSRYIIENNYFKYLDESLKELEKQHNVYANVSDDENLGG